MPCPQKNQGFTLLELLAAMGLLVIIVLSMSQVFTDSTRMWNLGTKRVVEAQQARVIMDFLNKEISMAIADDLVSFKIHSEISSPGNMSVSAYGEDTDSICFVSTYRTPIWNETRRSGAQYAYFVAYMEDDETGEELNEGHPDGPRYMLARKRLTRAMHSFATITGSVPDNPDLIEDAQAYRRLRIMNTAYKRKDWWLEDLMVSPTEVVAENLIAFEVWAQPQGHDASLGYNFDSTYIPPGSSLPLGAPLWIDLYLELMGDQEVRQLGQLIQAFGVDHADVRDFRERNVRRYSTRIYFRNRERNLL